MQLMDSGFELFNFGFERGDALLHGGADIDQHIPAADEVVLYEGRILDDIVFREDDLFADAGCDGKIGRAHV